MGDAAGAHLVVPLPDRVTELHVQAIALASGVAVDGLARHSHGTDGPAGLVLGWAAPRRVALVAALPVVAEALRLAPAG